MDSNLQYRSPDNVDGKPSFRKPLNDAANRKYRRRSPVSISPSSSLSGSPKHGRSPSPAFSGEDPIKNSDDPRRSENVSRSDRSSERQSYRSSHDYRRHDDYSRYHRHADGGERSYQRSSWSGRESRSGTGIRSDHMRQDSEYNRSRDYRQNADRYTRDKPDDEGHRSKDKERETMILERQKHKDKAFSSDRAMSGKRHTNSSLDEVKMGEREGHSRDRGGRDDLRDYRKNSGDYKNDHASSFEESKGHGKDSTAVRDNGGNRLKDTHKSSAKDLDGQKGERIEKRKHGDRESDKNTEKYNRPSDGKDYSASSYREQYGKNEQHQDKTSHANRDNDSSAKKLKLFNADGGIGNVKNEHFVSKFTSASDEGPPSSSKQAQEINDKVIPEPAQSSANQAEAAHDLDAAKIAAMKAAELVNRNLIGGGYMSTDQKKKLLWGNKKNTAAEESGHRWDVPLFSDRDRQEKFNKLMGVKGDLKPEHKLENKDGSGLLQAEKQMELQLDLEKQYTAGLRRRDGRTVGLGL